MNSCVCKFPPDYLTAKERGLSDKECAEHLWCEHKYWVICSECGMDEERLEK